MPELRGMLHLKDVTFVMVDTVCHRLAKMAVDRCLAQVSFGNILICSDNFNILRTEHAQHVLVPNWPTKLEWCQFMWRGLPPLIRTTHAMLCQWDAWITDPSKWTNEFLEYDLVGAPWEWGEEAVGNTGIGLKSKALMDYVAENSDRFPCNSDGEDHLLCNVYRPELEKAGFRWAPAKLARQFSCEAPWRPGTFGFHGAFNFHNVLERHQFRQMMTPMIDSPYIRRTQVVEELLTKYLWDDKQ